MSKPIMQQALDALKYHTEHTYQFHLTNVAIEALEAELAKPDLSIEANRVAYDVAMHYANKTKEKLG